MPKKSDKPQTERKVGILDLPNEILTKVLNYLPYENIGELRRVCKRFNENGCDILNSTFQHLQRRLLHRSLEIKAKMPLEKFVHNHQRNSLEIESEIIEALNMKLTMLQMTFGKHIENKYYCFFAGEILDEVLYILRYVSTARFIESANEVTEELFNLTTMVMEYLKKQTEPTPLEINNFNSDISSTTMLTTRPSCSNSKKKSRPNNLPEYQVKKLKQKLKVSQSKRSAKKNQVKLADQQNQSSKKEIQNSRENCSCRVIMPLPSSSIISVEDNDCPNKPKDSSHNTLVPIANSDNKSDVSERKCLRTSSGKRQQSRSDSKTSKRRKQGDFKY